MNGIIIVVMLVNQCHQPSPKSPFPLFEALPPPDGMRRTLVRSTSGPCRVKMDGSVATPLKDLKSCILSTLSANTKHTASYARSCRQPVLPLEVRSVFVLLPLFAMKLHVHKLTFPFQDGTHQSKDLPLAWMVWSQHQASGEGFVPQHIQ